MLDIESAQKGISEAKTVAEIEINGLQDQMKRLSDENEVMGRTFVTYANERSSLSIQVEAMTKRNTALEDQIQDIKERKEAEEGIKNNELEYMLGILEVEYEELMSEREHLHNKQDAITTENSLLKEENSAVKINSETKVAEMSEALMKAINKKNEISTEMDNFLSQNKALKMNITIIQKEKAELEARCIASTSENEDLVCESNLIREKLQVCNTKLNQMRKNALSRCIDFLAQSTIAS